MQTQRRFPLPFLLALTALVWSDSGTAQEANADAFTIFPSVLDASGGVVCGTPDYDLMFTLGEPSAVGRSENSQFLLWSGFQPHRRVTVLCPESSGLNDPGQLLPSRTRIYAVQPNPVTGVVRIRYDIAFPTTARLVIYDIQGREIRRFESRSAEAGTYNVPWDRKTSNGQTVPTGIYFARLVAGKTEAVHRFVVLR